MKTKRIKPSELIEHSQWDKHFGHLEDPRQQGKIQFSLMSLIAIATMAATCGLFQWDEIETWAELRAEWLASFLPLPSDGRTPSASTFERIFARLKPKAFAPVFLEWTKSLIVPAERPQLAIDGKTLRHAFAKASERSAFHIVTAFCTDNQVVLGQLRTEDKSNEIAAIPQLLATMELKGRLVSIDAAGTQVNNARIITEAEGDYVLPLKDNHPNAHREVDQFFLDAETESFGELEVHESKSEDRKHGRKEHRLVRAIAVPETMLTLDAWSNLQSLVQVRRERTVGDRKTSYETVYFLCSLPATDVKHIAASIRRHWGIENQLHWSLDVCFREDESRIHLPNAAENMATLRRFALGLHKLRTDSKRSLTKKALQCLISSDELVRTIFPANS